MVKVKCRQCKEMVDENAKVCPFCHCDDPVPTGIDFSYAYKNPALLKISNSTRLVLPICCAVFLTICGWDSSAGIGNFIFGGLFGFLIGAMLWFILNIILIQIDKHS